MALRLKYSNYEAGLNSVALLNSIRMQREEVIMSVEPGSKKRTILPNELFGKFSAKSDFIKYFREILQLYIPPEYMM
jgi:hypothetical protein